VIDGTLIAESLRVGANLFPGRIFRYPRGDEPGRAEAQAYGRQLAIPDPQLDWTV